MLNQKNNPKETQKKKIKSSAKAAGLKSTFVVGDNLLITSFGKGNEAILEKEIIGREINSLNNNEELLEVTAPKKNFYKIAGRIVKNGQITDPRSAEGVNIKKKEFKDKLENIYFGKTYDDNIHIQLIHNILDIEKILAVYVNNIVYSINNLRAKSEGEYDDFVGYMSTANSYERFVNYERDPFFTSGIKANIKRCSNSFNSLIKSKRLGYLGDYFTDGASAKNKNAASEALREKLYYTFCVLGEMRQYANHSGKSKAWPYNIDNERDEIKKLLDDNYNKRINQINKSFIKQNATNIYIIKKIFCDKDEKELIQTFYNFIVPKTHKNMGFSIKKLREKILELPEASRFKSKAYDSTRHKLYIMLDFVIYMQFKDDEAAIESMVTKLRSAQSDDEKEQIYIRKASELWDKIKSIVVNQISTLVSGKELSKNHSDIIKSDLVAPKACQAGYFSKMIYLLTLFLDGKEINDLITTLINKFDNIASFIDIVNEYNLECNFVKDYAMFTNSKKIVDELRVINSFARMQKASASAKKVMYMDAAEILGFKDSTKSLEKYIDEMLEKGKDGVKRMSSSNGFRNFIASNVIESSRFQYLVRYSNPKNVRKLANNRNVVLFVLKGIPDSQIERYFESCKCGFGSDADMQREALADIITGIDFNDFRNVKQNDRFSTGSEKADKAQKQAVISLYLTVLYLLTKNLVYVNSRYTLAFHCLERDSQIYGCKSGYFDKSSPENEYYCDLTKQFIEVSEIEHHKAEKQAAESGADEQRIKWSKGKNAPINKRACGYLKNNVSLSDNYAIHLYRNNAAHLSSVRNASLYINDIRAIESYFGLYHYLTQRAIEDQYKHNCEYIENTPKLKESTVAYFEKLHKYNTYCMDFVKALNTPFGYNLPRYKNLSVDALFDKNIPKEYNEKIKIEK